MQSKTANMAIKLLSSDDLKGISYVHIKAFPTSALTRLGIKPVMRYYDWQLNGPHRCVIIGAFLDDILVGFSCAGIFRGAFGGFIRHNRLILIAKILQKPWLVFNFEIRKGLKTTWRSFRPHKKTIIVEKERPFSILSIAVDPTFQGKGIGKALINKTEEIAKRWGYRKMNLTVHENNKQAIYFYQHNGFTIVKKSDVGGYLMEKKLE